MQERQGIFTWPGLEVREAKRAAWPTRLRRVIFVWEEELSSFYIRKISYLPFRTPPLVKLAGPARGWSPRPTRAVEPRIHMQSQRSEGKRLSLVCKPPEAL